MKTITFLLSLVSASLTVTAAAAAQNENLVVTLPAHNVTAPRYTEAEKAIVRSLADLRAKAQPVTVVRTELPSLNTVAQQQPPVASDSRAVAAAPAPKHVQTRS